ALGVGAAERITVTRRGRHVAVIGSEGLGRISLTTPDVVRVALADDQDSADAFFALMEHDENVAPDLTTDLTLNTREDVPIALPQPGIAVAGSDADVGDTFIIIQKSDASLGTAVVAPDGGFSYAPLPDVHGTDSFQIVLTDGRDTSPHRDVTIEIASVIDPPGGININLVNDHVPENIGRNEIIANIDFIGPDPPGPFVVNFDHPGLNADGRNIVAAEDDVFNFEGENEIFVNVLIEAVDGSFAFGDQLLLQITDANDPVTDIIVDGEFFIDGEEHARLNAPEETSAHSLGIVHVLDEDANSSVSFNVSDSRFIISNQVLQLADGAVLDFETEETVSIQITADDGQGSSRTESFTVQVENVIETPTAMTLSPESVLELVVGASVGQIGLEGGDAADQFDFFVSDSRFVVDGTNLRLRSDQFVRFVDGETIPVAITAVHRSDDTVSFAGEFSILVLENPHPFHNATLP
ncbi:MAG: Ig-like domain-containing protein, partial [Planctomycetota bacterium]